MIGFEKEKEIGIAMKTIRGNFAWNTLSKISEIQGIPLKTEIEFSKMVILLRFYLLLEKK